MEKAKEQIQKSKKYNGNDKEGKMTSFKYTDKELIKIALANKEHFFHVATWDRYAKQNNLPASKTYARRFGSWIEAVDEILGEFSHDSHKYNEETLKDIAFDHIGEFTSKANWDKYAKENSLPYSFTYRQYFGSWAKAKSKLGIAAGKKTRRKTIDMGLTEMKTVALENKEMFTTRACWDEFATRNGYRSSSSYALYLGDGTWNKAKERLGILEVDIRKYSNEELISIAIEHKDAFITKALWDKLAKEKGLPWSPSYRRSFGTWGKAKIMVQEYIKALEEATE